VRSFFWITFVLGYFSGKKKLGSLVKYYKIPLTANRGHIMIAKIHKTPEGEIIVAVCDKNLLGQKFEEDGLIIDLSSDFYGGDEMNEEEVGDLIRNACMVNLVGPRAIKLGFVEEIIDDSNVKKIAGIPYANVSL